MTACVCGAHKTYKAGPKSTLHSDWCDESPRFVPKAKVFTAKNVEISIDCKPLQFYAGTFKLAAPPAAPKPDCYGCDTLYGRKVPSDWSIWYPANNWSATPQTRTFCSSCAPTGSHQNLRASGCKITAL